MPVIDGAGLVGKVTKVYPDRSVVLLITDPEFTIEAKVLSRVDDEDAASTTSSAPPNTADQRPTARHPPRRRAPRPRRRRSRRRRRPPTTTPFGATPGQTTTSTSSTTTTTLPEIDVSRETGDIDGQGADRPLLFSLIDDTALTNVKVGATVETAGGAKSLAPQGIPIGKITAVTQRLGSRSPIVEVEPNASLTQLNFVSVLLFVPNQAAI